MEERSFERGEIYVANLSPYIGSEQGGTRPVIILQNNLGTIYSPTLIVAPLTSRTKKKAIPTHYLIEDMETLKENSLVLLEQIKTIDKQRVGEYIYTHVLNSKMDEEIKKFGVAKTEDLEDYSVLNLDVAPITAMSHT